MGDRLGCVRNQRDDDVGDVPVPEEARKMMLTASSTVDTRSHMMEQVREVVKNHYSFNSSRKSRDYVQALLSASAFLRETIKM